MPSPTSMRAFRAETNSGPYQWQNGLVQPIPSVEQHYWTQYSTTSMFWCEDSRGFLQVPHDRTKVDVSDALSTSERDIPLPWSGLTFRHTLGPDNRSPSLVGYAYEELILDSLVSLAWMPELLSQRYDGRLNDRGTARLAGDLPVMIGLAAFSAPPDKMMEAIRNSFRAAGPHWIPHDHRGEGIE